MSSEGVASQMQFQSSSVSTDGSVGPLVFARGGMQPQSPIDTYPAAGFSNANSLHVRNVERYGGKSVGMGRMGSGGGMRQYGAVANPSPVQMHSSAYVYGSYADPLEDISSSTIAMVILFGSILFATVGMAARAWLVGDNRAFVTAISIKVESATPDHVGTNAINGQGNATGRYTDEQSVRSSYSRDSVMSRSVGSNRANPAGHASGNANSVLPDTKDNLWGNGFYWSSGVEFGGEPNYVHSDSRSTRSSKTMRSAGSRSSIRTSGANLTKPSSKGIPIRPWEPNFVSTYVLFHQATIFGAILFLVYLADRHPPFGSYNLQSERVTCSPSPTLEQSCISRFDEDQFVFWTILLLLYGYFASWRRNDGRSNDFKPRLSLVGNESLRDDGSEASRSTKSGGASRRRRQQHRRQKSGDGVSSHGSDARNVAEGYVSSTSRLASLLSSLRPGEGLYYEDGGDAISRKSGASRCDSKSSQGSDISKRLEDVLLDDDDEEEEQRTVEDQTPDNDDNEKLDWLHHGSKLLGIHIGEGTSMGVVYDAVPENDVLNRSQTLEWKGFLSALLLIFQYNNGGSSDSFKIDNRPIQTAQNGGTDIYYNLVKVAATSFFFLTGFNHASYFYYQPTNMKNSSTISSSPSALNEPGGLAEVYRTSISHHYGLSRVIDVLFRINWTAIFLCLILGNSLLTYVACPLHTYFFLGIWSTMKYRSAINYTKYKFRLKLFILACLMFVYWDCDFGLFGVLNRPFFLAESAREGNASMPSEHLWEWYFNTHLHHWSAFTGVIFAVNQHILSLQLRKMEALNMASQILSKGSIFVALSAMVMAWVMGPLRMTGLTYNSSHPYFGFLPILAFIYWRNMNHSSRERHVGMFRWLGEYSLEIYLLHHHAFSNENILVVLPGFPRCNFLLLSILLLFLARILHKVTLIIRRMLLPENDEKKCIWHISVISVSVLILYVLSRSLHWANMVTVGTITTTTIICGILLYQTTMDLTWMGYRSASLRPAKYRYSSDPVVNSKLDMNESNVAKISPPLVGTLSVLLTGAIWFGWALSNGSSSRAPLDMSCEALVNNGLWIPVKLCTSSERGNLYRQFDSMTYFGSNGCSDLTTTKQWAWPDSSSSAVCNFRYRSNNEIQRKLKGRKIIMIGDFSVRGLFYAICRFMGDFDAGGYDGTTPSHSDSIRQFASSALEYKWAPLTVDAVKKLKNLRTVDFSIPGKFQPGLVIVGGGAWDRLHVSVTDEDEQSHRAAVSKLASELRTFNDMGVPTVWFTPPTINTRALDEEKRTQMSEKNIQEMRLMYAEVGVESSASFVIDGPSFTAGRVVDSYDGVHYPPEVYDAGAQILFNAFDWIFDESNVKQEIKPPRLGSLSNPYLGLMMLCFASIGLFFFDGYLGFSYFAQCFVRKNIIAPGELYEESTSPMFTRLKLLHLNEDEGTSKSLFGDYSDNTVSGHMGRPPTPLNRRRQKNSQRS